MKKMNLDFTHSKAFKWTVIPIVAVVIALLPWITSQYIQRILIMLGVYLVLALSLNFITGYMGQVSLGHAAFYCIGAYTSALLSKYFGLNFVICAIAGACMAALLSLCLGFPTLRLSGTYLAITTLGFLEVIRMIALNWESVTGGPLGVSKIARPVIFGFELKIVNGGFYYLIVLLVLLTLLVSYLIVNSKQGRAIMSVREDELAANLMGIYTFRYKLLAFVLAAFFAGLAGAFYAHFMGYIDQNSFTFDISITILSMVILGGMGTLKGMIVGAALLSPLPELLRGVSSLMSSFPSWLQIEQPDQLRFVIYGLILVLMMRFRPQGLLGGQSKKPYKMPKGIKLEEGENYGAARG